jgi:predicted extracellular nuclease
MLHARELRAQSISIGFYNCENLYDTIDDKHVMDQPFTPKGEKKYIEVIYKEKVHHIAYVIDRLKHVKENTSLAFMGLAEIENKNVLQDIIHDSVIQSMHLQFVHYDSKDYRGIDVALLYQPTLFKPYQSKNFNLFDSIRFHTYQTRDILWVKGKLGDHWVSILVNHWPSRRNNSPSAKADRIWAATRCRQIIDSLTQLDPSTPFIVMGDFNDNPTDPSIQTLHLINPFAPLFQVGKGSLVFSGHWFLFDQIMFTPSAIESLFQTNSCKSIIYKDDSIVSHYGQQRSMPYSSYRGNLYQGGFSDHLPVALIFKLKNAKNALK